MINILDLLPQNDEALGESPRDVATEKREDDPLKKQNDLIASRPLGFKSGKVFRFDLPDSPQVINYTTADQTIKSATFEKIIEKITSKSVRMYYLT